MLISCIRWSLPTKLKDALIPLLNHLRRLEDLKVRVKQALAYPIFMSLVGVGTIL